MPLLCPRRLAQLLSTALLLLAARPLVAQSALTDLVEAFKNNVVRVTSRFADANPEQGFAFIVGEKDGQLYLVTAGHVVHGANGAGRKPQKIELGFTTSLRIYLAEEETWLEDDDLSLLTLPKPPGLQWNPRCLGAAPAQYQKVRFIGSQGDWVSPGEGEIFRLRGNTIDFSIGTVTPGTSGAPLLNASGIIGMVLTDQQANSSALSIARIQARIGGTQYPYWSLQPLGSSAPPPGGGDPAPNRPPDRFGLIKIAGGTFTMGCTSEQGGDCSDWEKPVHQVMVGDFELGATEVTQAQWRAVMGSNPSSFKGCDQCPVELVSWEEVQAFLQKLNAQTGGGYRLPTEAEWEYAARGGRQSRGYKYAGSENLDAVAWYGNNSGSKTHPVGQKAPNELGLYDLSGNVWEWCQDWYGDYPSTAQRNPSGPSTGSDRVIRGGGWLNVATYCRVADRSHTSPGIRDIALGFRLAR